MACSREFREGLRRELTGWQSDGIVTPGAAHALASRYDLEHAGAAGARRDHSAAIAGASAAVLACALALALATASSRAGALLPLAALGAAFASAPLVLRGAALAPTATAVRGVGRGLFYLAAFALSFVPVAGALLLRSPGSAGFAAAVPPFLLAVAALAAGLRRADVDAHARGEAMLLTATVIAFAAGLFLETGIGAAVVANLALAFLAAGRIVRGLSWLARAPFWEGLVVAAIVGMSRVLEVKLDGWPRFTSAFLIAAGAVAAGTAFELRRARTPDEARARTP